MKPEIFPLLLDLWRAVIAEHDFYERDCSNPEWQGIPEQAICRILADLEATKEEPKTRTDAFGETVCASCGYHDGQHGEDCHA